MNKTLRKELASISAVLVCWMSNSVSMMGDEISYSRDVRPILAANCFNCHGFDAGSRQGGLRLDRQETAAHVLVEINGSIEMLDRVTSGDPEVRMPPPESKLNLSANEINVIKQWLAQGAKYEGHWAFQPPAKPKVPMIESTGLRNPIDNFIQSRLLAE